VTALPARAEVSWWELADVGRRPVVVLSRDVVIPLHRRVLVAPCTTTIRGLVSEVVLDPTTHPRAEVVGGPTSTRSSVSLGVLVDRVGLER
jgi:mRNA interferase MazF